MRKIPSVFERDFNAASHPVYGRSVLNAINPAADWVAAGEGVATRKWDGIAVLIRNGKPFVRFDAKAGRTPPANFEPAQPQPDAKSGHWPGWVPAEMPAGRYVLEALTWAAGNRFPEGIPDGTYEAVGPKIGTRHGANPESLSEHILVPHGVDVITDAPRDFNGLMEYLRDKPIEGIVWHHPDGRMAKIKRADFPYHLVPGVAGAPPCAG